MRILINSVLAVLSVCSAAAVEFSVHHDQEAGKIVVSRDGAEVLTQNAREDFRPYLHPVRTPDGKSVVTEFSPDHHKHQTGIYWGLTDVNGRSFFLNPGGDHWRRKSAEVKTAKGNVVNWTLEYELLGEDGGILMTETQNWFMFERDGTYMLDFYWNGKAHVDLKIAKYDYGGLFVRMPWREGIEGAVVNAARQRNQTAEGKRAPWLDVGMKIEGRDDQAHIAIFDHGSNPGFPQHWRVDGQMGVGPVRSRAGDWGIEKGKQAKFQHRFVIYTGELDDLKLKTMWSEYTGKRNTWSLWNLAQEEGRQAEFLTPERAVEEMTVADGFEVNVWAAEPMITQPMAFCWDDKGRMWVAENRDYETRQTGFSNSGDSRILILEDTDRDGVADSRKVFAEGIPFPAAVAVGMGGLWLGAPPNLLFIPDKDGDDRGDMDAVEVRLTGWGIRDRHETLNSFHWGPDGWLYGCQGYATPSRVGKPVDGARLLKAKEPFPGNIPLKGKGTDIDGGVWRYHPTKDRFEVVAHGFSNPWGIDYDAKGNLFITACVIPHMFHIVQGGIFHRQGGSHFNPYVYEDIRTIVDHTHRSAHGGARIYQSDAFPEKYRGQLFMANIHEHAVLADILAPKGSGFVAKHGEDFMLANNAQWIGFSVEIGPEGGLYVLDWHDADICGKEVLNKETGRIFRIMPKETRAKDWPGRYGDLKKLSDLELVDLQLNKSDWHARRARVIMQERDVDKEAVAKLKEIFAGHENVDIRLRAMWALHVTGNLEPSASLDDKEEYVRSWAVQLMCEDGAPEALFSKMAAMAKSDASPVVRRYLASALQTMPLQERWPVAEALASHAEDADDHNIPKMVWFGIEPAVPEDPARALTFAKSCWFPKLPGWIARRLVAAGKVEPLVAAIGEDSPARQGLVNGLRDALEGMRDPAQPSNWGAVYAVIKDDPAVSGAARAIAQKYGDASARREMFALITNAKARPEARQNALRGLAQQQRPELLQRLEGFLGDDVLRTEAIRAVAAFDDPRLADILLKRYENLNESDKLEAVQTLASRPKYGGKLTEALKSGRVPKRDVPAYVARQLRRVVGNGFVEVWGPIDQLSEDKEAAYAKYRALLTDEAVSKADIEKGRAVFDRTCAACHKMYGKGGTIGPDLTGSNRGDLNYILSNIVEPSGVIQDAYKMVIVTTRDGRTYAGNVAAEDDRSLTLRVVGQEEGEVIAKSLIQSREVAPVSLMPEGLLNTMKDAEVVDLIGYLRAQTE